MNEKFEAKLEKIRTHLKNNKERYYIGITCFIAGGVACAILRGPQVTNNYIAPTGEGVGNNFGTAIYKRISNYGNPLGRHGNVVVELDTFNNIIDKPLFQSQTLAAKDAGVSSNEMFRHLQGEYPHLNGRRFMRLRDLVEQWEIMAEMHSEAA